MISDRNHNEDLELWLKFIEPYLDDLSSNEKKNVQLWLNKLFEPNTNVNIALDYLKLLVDSVQQHKIDELFMKPPQEGQLPKIPSNILNGKKSGYKHSNFGLKNYTKINQDINIGKKKSKGKYDNDELLDCVNYMINRNVLKKILQKKSKAIKKIGDEKYGVKKKDHKYFEDLENTSTKYRLVLKCKPLTSQKNEREQTDKIKKSTRTTQKGNGDISDMIKKYSNEAIYKIEEVFDNVEIELNEEDIYKIARNINNQKNNVINGLPIKSRSVSSHKEDKLNMESRHHLKKISGESIYKDRSTSDEFQEINNKVEKIVGEIRKELNVDVDLDEIFGKSNRSRDGFYSKLFTKSDAQNKSYCSKSNSRRHLDFTNEKYKEKNIENKCRNFEEKVFEQLNSKEYKRDYSEKYGRESLEEYDRANSKDYNMIKSKKNERKQHEIPDKKRERQNIESPNGEYIDKPNMNQNDLNLLRNLPKSKRNSTENLNPEVVLNSKPKKRKRNRKPKSRNKEKLNDENYVEQYIQLNPDRSTRPNLDNCITPNLKEFERAHHKQIERENGEEIERENYEQIKRENYEQIERENGEKFERKNDNFGKNNKEQFKKENYKQFLEQYGLKNENLEEKFQENLDNSKKRSSSRRRKRKRPKFIDTPDKTTNNLDEYVILNMDEYKRLNDESKYKEMAKPKFHSPKYDEKNGSKHNELLEYDDRLESKYDQPPDERPKYEEVSKCQYEDELSMKRSKHDESKYVETSKFNRNERKKYKNNKKPKSKSDDSDERVKSKSSDGTFSIKSKSIHKEPEMLDKSTNICESTSQNSEYFEDLERKKLDETQQFEYEECLDQYEKQYLEDLKELEQKRSEMGEYQDVFGMSVSKGCECTDEFGDPIPKELQKFYSADYARFKEEKKSINQEDYIKPTTDDSMNSDRIKYKDAECQKDEIVENYANPDLDHYENMSSEDRFRVILENLKASLENSKPKHESLKSKHQKDLDRKFRHFSPKYRRDSSKLKRRWSKIKRNISKAKRESRKSIRINPKCDNPESEEEKRSDRTRSIFQNPRTKRSSMSSVLNYEKIYEDSKTKYESQRKKYALKSKRKYFERPKAKYYYRSQSKTFENSREKSNRIRYQRLILDQYDELNNNENYTNFIDRINSTIFEQPNYETPNYFNYKSFSECNIPNPKQYLKIEIHESGNSRKYRCRSSSPQKRRYVHTNTSMINIVGGDITRSEIFNRPFEKDKIYMINTPVYFNFDKEMNQYKNEIYAYPSYSYQNFYTPYRDNHYEYIISDDGMSIENDFYEMGMRRVQDWNTYISQPVYYAESIVLDDPYWGNHFSEDAKVHPETEGFYIAKHFGLSAGYNDLCEKDVSHFACKKVDKGMYVAECEGPEGTKKVPFLIRKRVIPVDSQNFTEILNCERTEKSRGKVERVPFVPAPKTDETVPRKICCPAREKLCDDYVCGCKKFYENMGMIDPCREVTIKKNLPCGGRVLMTNDQIEERRRQLREEARRRKEEKRKKLLELKKQREEEKKERERKAAEAAKKGIVKKEKKEKKEKKPKKTKKASIVKKDPPLVSRPTVNLNDLEDDDDDNNNKNDGTKLTCYSSAFKCDRGVCTCGAPPEPKKVSVGTTCNPDKCTCGPKKDKLHVDNIKKPGKTGCSCGLKAGTENSFQFYNSTTSFKKELFTRKQIRKILNKQFKYFSKICKHYKNTACSTSDTGDGRENYVSIGVQPSIVITPTNHFYDENLLEDLLNKTHKKDHDVLFHNKQKYIREYLKRIQKNIKPHKNVYFQHNYHKNPFNLVSSLTKFHPNKRSYYRSTTNSTLSKTSYLRCTDLDAQSIDYSLRHLSSHRSFPSFASTSATEYTKILEKKLNSPESSDSEKSSKYSKSSEKSSEKYSDKSSDKSSGKSSRRSSDKSYGRYSRKPSDKSSGKLSYKYSGKYSSKGSISVPASKIKKSFPRKSGRKVTVRQFLYLLENLKKIIND